jgi:hypothetical protein
MNNLDYDYINSFGFILKGGIIKSIEELLENKNVVKIVQDKEKNGIEYYFNNNECHYLSNARFSLIIEKYPQIFLENIRIIKDFFHRKYEIDNIRKKLLYENIKEFKWENLIYIENVNLDLNKNLAFNINIIKNYLSEKYCIKNEVDTLINSAWKNFFNFSYMEKYTIPTIEKYDYWKSLHKGNISFDEAYKDYKN